MRPSSISLLGPTELHNQSKLAQLHLVTIAEDAALQGQKHRAVQACAVAAVQVREHDVSSGFL
jgi:hypothetical protein